MALAFNDPKKLVETLAAEEARLEGTGVESENALGLETDPGMLEGF